MSCIWISTAISRPRKSHFHSPKGAAGAHNVEMWKHKVEMWKHTKLEANTQLHSGNRIGSNRRRKKHKNVTKHTVLYIHTNQLKKCQQKMKQIPIGQLAKRSNSLFFN